MTNQAARPPSLTESENTLATPIGIPAPADADYPSSALTVTALPSDRIKLLADGLPPVTLGETFSVQQLTGLKLRPTLNSFGTSSSFKALGKVGTGPRRDEHRTLADATVTYARHHRQSAHVTTGAYVPVDVNHGSLSATVGVSIGAAATVGRAMAHDGASSPLQADDLSRFVSTTGSATAAILDTASLLSVGAGTASPATESMTVTNGADFAPLSTVNPSANLNSAETSALASATKLVSDVFIPVPGSSNQTAAEDSRSDISAIPALGSSNQTAAEDPRSDINAWSASWRSAVASVDALTGADGDQPTVLNNTLDLGLLSGPSSSAPGGQSANASTNPIVIENHAPGQPGERMGH